MGGFVARNGVNILAASGVQLYAHFCALRCVDAGATVLRSAAVQTSYGESLALTVNVL